MTFTASAGIQLDDDMRVAALEAEISRLAKAYCALFEDYERRGVWLLVLACAAMAGWAVAAWRWL